MLSIIPIPDPQQAQSNMKSPMNAAIDDLHAPLREASSGHLAAVRSASFHQAQLVLHDNLQAQRSSA
ncbi:hypothetical protein CHELA1G11_21918 [Hyphomicrobiales bacterium]|nr:hypothetical protein CHELA1G2_20182 [Hyphomicrobiales bacterium]CAH1695579.1 hypothetical protein CHELA1G11_21918 [Hyphomicrobiales bacterium]